MSAVGEGAPVAWRVLPEIPWPPLAHEAAAQEAWQVLAAGEGDLAAGWVLPERAVRRVRLHSACAGAQSLPGQAERQSPDPP